MLEGVVRTRFETPAPAIRPLRFSTNHDSRNTNHGLRSLEAPEPEYFL